MSYLAEVVEAPKKGLLTEVMESPKKDSKKKTITESKEKEA